MKTIRGINKFGFVLFLKMNVAFYIVRKYLFKIRFLNLLNILKRLDFFIGKIKHNKFIDINGLTKLNLYIPAFPSKAFYTACEKFTVFDDKLPCTTVLISITSACPYHCEHCYQKLDQGKDVDIEILIEVVKKLQKMGIAFFNIEGGEPFIKFDRLEKICSVIDKRSEIWINSTGFGITKEKLQLLKKHNTFAIMFSLHSSEPEQMNKFLGKDSAWETMEKAIKLCHEVGINISFNSCLQKQDFYNGNFDKLMKVAKDKRACILQLIKPKPSGGWLQNGVESYSRQDYNFIREKVNQYNFDPKFKEYPAISAQINEEAPEMFGCTAGGTDRFYINAKGDVQACEFLNLSFGNIQQEDFFKIYHKMRTVFEIPTQNLICEQYAKQIYQLFCEKQSKILPLNPKLSENIYCNWNRGNPTNLYWKIEKQLK